MVKAIFEIKIAIFNQKLFKMVPFFTKIAKLEENWSLWHFELNFNLITKWAKFLYKLSSDEKVGNI